MIPLLLFLPCLATDLSSGTRTPFRDTPEGEREGGKESGREGGRKGEGGRKEGGNEN